MSEPDQEYIIPQYKIIVTYDIATDSREEYLKFIMSELVPALQERNIFMAEVWHTSYGNYPLRMITFVAEDRPTIDALLSSELWEDLRKQLIKYVKNYSLLVVPYRQGFQFAQK
nr:hypothetical protein [Anaerolineae bacterium]